MNFSFDPPPASSHTTTPSSERNIKKGFTFEETQQKSLERNTLSTKKKRNQSVWAKRLKSSESEEDKKEVENLRLEFTSKRLDIEKFIALLGHENGQKQLHGLKQLRKILSIQSEEIRDIITQLLSYQSFLPLLQKHLHKVNAEHQLEAVWCITNIAANGSSEHVGTIIQFAPDLILYLGGDNSTLQEQCILALGNIAAESKEFVQTLVKNGILKPLLNVLSSAYKPKDLLSNAMWCLSNFIKEQDYFEELFANSLPEILIKLLQIQSDQLLVEVAWVLTYLTAKQEQYVYTLLQKGLHPHLLKALLSGNNDIALPCLRVLGNIVRLENNNVIDVIFNQSGSQLVSFLLNQLNPNSATPMTKDAAWVVSNIAGGSPQHVDVLVNHKFIPVLLQLLSQATYEVKKEIVYSITNICSDGRYVELVIFTKHQTEQQRTIPSPLVGFTELLNSSFTAPELKILILRFLQFLLKTNNKTRVWTILEECNGAEVIENLTMDQNNMISTLAQQIADSNKKFMDI